MPQHKESDNFWDLYWETRLLPMENLGKRMAILAASGLIRRLEPQFARPLRLLELGCGEGQVIGALLDAHYQICDIHNSVGLDYNARSLAQCRRDFPGLRCVEGDFTDPALLAELGQFEIVLLVNALHEVFSASISPELDEVDIPLGKARVEQALAGAAGRLAPGGWLVLFDGLEPPGDPLAPVQIRFRDREARQQFDQFVQAYRPFHIEYRQLENPLSVRLTRRSFTRYITKSIFLGKKLWESERFESYQYFTAEEFRSAFERTGLEIQHLETFTMNEEKWRRKVEIVSKGEPFPQEHILIMASAVDLSR